MKTEKTQKTERILIERNNEAIAFEKSKADAVLPLLQNFIDEGKKAELEITNDNFLQVSRDPVSFAKGEYEKTIDTDNVPVVAGRKLSKAAILETYEFPDTVSFVAAANAFREQLNAVQKQFIQIVDGEACINQDEVNIYIEKASTYVTNPDAIELWNSYNQMIESMNKVKTIVWDKFGTKMYTYNLKDFIDGHGDDPFTLRMSTFKRMTER